MTHRHSAVQFWLPSAENASIELDRPSSTHPIAEQEVEHDQRPRERENRFQQPTEHDAPTRAERAPAASFTHKADCERRRAAGREHAAIAAYRVATARARTHRDRPARSTARVRRTVAVRLKLGHRRF
jgi:hypothetical protein